MRNKHSTRRNPQQEQSPSILIPGPDVLRELIPIVLDEDAASCSLWTVHEARQQRVVRKTIQIYVDFTLEVEPYDGSETIGFLFAAPEDEIYLGIYHEAPNEEQVRQLAEAVLLGVKDALQEKAAEGTRMANLLVGLTGLSFHLTQSWESYYRYSANKLMHAFLEPSNLVNYTS